MEIDALLLTARLAFATTAILLAISIPLAWWIVSGNGLARAVVQTTVALPLVLPPTVLGFYLLVALGPLSAPGRLLIRLVGHPLAFSFSGLLVGSLVYSLPFAVQPIVSGMRSVDPQLLETIAGLGISPAKVFRDVVFPHIQASVITSALLTFTHTVGEFGVVLMLGGNIPGSTRTLSISIFDLVENGDYTAANRSALFLLATSGCALLAIYLLPHRTRTSRSGLLG